MKSLIKNLCLSREYLINVLILFVHPFPFVLWLEKLRKETHCHLFIHSLTVTLLLTHPHPHTYHTHTHTQIDTFTHTTPPPSQPPLVRNCYLSCACMLSLSHLMVSFLPEQRCLWKRIQASDVSARAWISIGHGHHLVRSVLHWALDDNLENKQLYSGIIMQPDASAPPLHDLFNEISKVDNPTPWTPPPYRHLVIPDEHSHERRVRLPTCEKWPQQVLCPSFSPSSPSSSSSSYRWQLAYLDDIVLNESRNLEMNALN